MCGIIARVSKNTCPIKTLEGLKFLEYRGYDSYGILLSNEDEEMLQKDIGELPREQIDILKNFKSNIEIGHTRWATHGGVTKTNAHPHFDKDRKFYVIMNGIIENYLDIKTEFKDKINFISESDTEVIPQLYSYYLKETKDSKSDLLLATKKIMEKLNGEFSFVVKYKNILLTYKNINPIIIGTKKNEIIISSDIGLVQNNSQKYNILNDDEILITSIENGNINLSLLHNFEKITFDWKKSVKSEMVVNKEHGTYMEKEIYEQKYIRNLITSENLSSINYLNNTIKNKKNLVLTAAGTSYHAAYYMHYMLLKEGINSDVILASELNNYTKVITNSMIVVISQSGETADLIHPLKALRDENEIFTITNTPNSTLDRFASRSIHLNCGREIAVASTKAFSSQIFVAYLLKEKISKKKISEKLSTYEREFDKVLAKNKPIIKEICKKFKKSKDFFFIGRDENHPLALEGALKLKEISYIHAEGFAGGELKHGTLALIEKGIPVVVLGNSQETISNAIEIKTRGGIIIGISDQKSIIFDYHLSIPKYYKEIFMTVLIQQLALEMTLELDRDPDKPRNLAKSVTVK